MSLVPDDHSLFGFDTEDWLERLQQAETLASLGRLGRYELLGEAGRGGQGVVFRARQPGTGRDIALKRLIAGTFASAAARRRFEREVEAVTALSHPGIVTVYGVDDVEGSPLLAMEWIEGEPVTDWARERSRDDVLQLFLLVCDALQHAHQRGVLHRDLKPSNVIVDRGGRPRVLDFGLAKIATDRHGPISISGEFVGTPAYAAPEQWRAGDVDARADVYSLGALLFEMLTGRRVLEGDGLELLARAEQSEPPRPSSLRRSIPRELDAIVMQALAREREARYQSVDALSSDVRRFLAGEPVLAHPPGAWYQLRKLVARNRVAAALFALLLVATVAYALVATRQARRLTEERNRAVAATAAESLARTATEAEKRRAEEALARAEEGERRLEAALAETELERQRANAENEKGQAALKFLVEDVIAAADPQVLGHEPTLLEILQAAAPKVAQRFGHSPAVELVVRSMLSDAFFGLGRYSDAATHMRRSLELRRADPETTQLALARAENHLGNILVSAGARDEAETLFKSAIARFEATDPIESAGLASALNNLGGVYIRTLRSAEAIPYLERALAVDTAGDEDQLAARNNLASAYLATGRLEEARRVFEEALEASIARSGERTAPVATLTANLGCVHQQLGDLAQAETHLRRALELEAEIFGAGHARSAPPMVILSQVLVARGELEEAVDLARRAVEIMRVAAPGSPDVAVNTTWLGAVLLKKGDAAQAAEAYAEALSLLPGGPDDPNRLTCAFNLGVALTSNGKLDEAEPILVDVAERRRRVYGPASVEVATALHALARLSDARGELEEAAQLYEESVTILASLPAERAKLAGTLEQYAALLRKKGEAERAAELEKRAAELGR